MTVRALLDLRSRHNAIADHDIDTAMKEFAKLSQPTAARVLRFWQVPSVLKLARNDGDRRVAETRLRTDVLKHVRDISEKYLIAGETHETAVLFVPSESVYADIHERFEDVIQKAHRSRVIFASPNVLMLLIQTMQAVFKDQRMREQAGLIKVEVSRLLEDVGRLKERIGDLQKHFGAANSDLDKLNVSADKVAKRGLRIESLDLSEIAEEAEVQRLAG